MQALILTSEKQTALGELNAAGDPFKQLIPAPLLDGASALNADLLTDCGPGQTWEFYEEFLQSLPVETRELGDFAES